jgi:copper transport protein
MTHRLSLPNCIWLLALLLILWPARSVWAHPQILSITPPPDALLETTPPAVTITFNEPLEPLSRLEVRDAQAALVVEGRTPNADPAVLALDLPPLPNGVYTVIYTVAGSDGHIVRGNFAFTVQNPNATPTALPEAGVTPQPTPVAAPAQPPAPPPPTAAPGPAPHLLRWGQTLGSIGVVGGWIFWSVVLQPSLAPIIPAAGLLRRWRFGMAALALLALGATLALLLQFTADLSGALSVQTLTTILTGTRNGGLFAARIGVLGALLVLGLVTARATPGRLPTLLALALSGLLLVLHAAGGHAATQATPAIGIAVLTVHLAATSIWIGGLALFALTIGPLRAAHPAHLPRLVRRFSTLALLSVAALTLSGVISAARELTALADLWQTAYGQALLLKTALFGGLLLFGAYHLLRLSPALRRSPADPTPPRRLQRSMRFELALGSGVLLVAAILATLPPPASAIPLTQVPAPTPTAVRVPTVTPGPTRTPVPSQPFSAEQIVADLVIRFAVEPASIGANRFEVTVTDRQGQPIAAQLVRLTFTMPAMDMGINQLVAQPIDATTFATDGSPLSMVGEWDAAVLVRRADAPDATATFRFFVGE